MMDEFLEFINRLRGATDEKEFRKIWREYTEGIKVGGLEDFWISKLLDRFGDPAGIFVALREGKEIVTVGDLKMWAIEKAGKYEYKEE